MRLATLGLERYGALTDVSVGLGAGLTVVAGPNESGKSTTLHALADLLWGMPYRHRLADLVPRAQLRLTADVVALDGHGTGTGRLVRTSRGLHHRDGVQPAPNPWGADGEEYRAAWLRRFGLDHEALRDGGRLVCAGDGDLAELVFTARQGDWVHALLRDLDQRADQLFKDYRGSRQVAIRRALAAYQQGRVAFDEAVTRSGEVVAARARLEALTGQAAEAAMAVADATRQVTTLAEYRRCLDDAVRLRAVRQRMAAVRSGGATLDRDALDVHDEASAAVGEAGRERGRLGEQLATWRREFQALTVDERLLADGDELDALLRQREARSGDRARAGTLTGQAEGREQAARAALEALTGRTEPHDHDIATLLDALAVPGDLAAQLDEAAGRHPGLVTVVEAAVAQTDEAATVLAGLPPVPDLPDREAITPLLGILDTLDADGSPLARARAAQAAGAAGRDGCRQALLAAGCRRLDAEPPQPPSDEQLTEEIERLDTAGAAAKRAAERLDEARATLESAKDQLDKADTADLVELADVRAARIERDTRWQTIRDSWIDGVAVAGQEPAALADAFETSLHASDGLADRFAQQTKRLATLANRRQAVAKAEAESATRETERRDAAAGSEAAQTAWDARWAALDVTPPAASRAHAVRQHLVDATEARLQATTADEEAAAAVPEILGWAGRLRRTLADLGRPQPPPAIDAGGGNHAAPGCLPAAIVDLETLLTAARTLRREVDDAREPREQHRSGAQALDRARGVLAAAERDLTTWATSWQRLGAAAGMAEAVDPRGWAARREYLAEAHEAHAEANRLRGEADALLAAWTAFADRVAALGQRHGAAGDVEQILDALTPCLAQSRADQQLHAQRRSDIATAEQDLAKVAERLDGAAARLDELRDRYALADAAGLADAVARGRDLVELGSQEAALLQSLRSQADPGHDPDDLLAALADLDDAAITVQRETADAELTRARDRHAALLREQGAAERELNRLQRDGDAAELHARAQSQLAEVADLAE